MEDCLFCKIIARELPSSIVAESDLSLVIKDIDPKAPIHLLIIPKVHSADIRTLNDFSIGEEIFRQANALSGGTEPFKLVINNGYAAGQRLFHTHAHYLAGSIIPNI